MKKQCTECIKKEAEIKALQKEIAKLQAKINSAGKYCQDNVSRAKTLLETNLGMRTYGKMVATVEHLTNVANVLDFPIEQSPTNSLPWRKFRRFLS